MSKTREELYTELLTMFESQLTRAAQEVRVVLDGGDKKIMELMESYGGEEESTEDLMMGEYALTFTPLLQSLSNIHTLTTHLVGARTMMEYALRSARDGYALPISSRLQVLGVLSRVTKDGDGKEMEVN